MEATTTKTGAKAKTAKGKGKPASKPATPKASAREQFRAECAKYIEALAILSEAEDAVLALIPVDERKEVCFKLDVVRSAVFATFPV